MTDSRATGGHRRVATVCVIYREGGVLFYKRREDHSVDPGCWGFVGGAQEGSESLPDCLHREVMEETGIAVAGAEYLGWLEYGDDWVLFVYGATTVQTPKLAEPDVFSEFMWADPEDLPTPQRPCAQAIMDMAMPFIRKQNERY